MIASAFAPAKINLFLHVGAPVADGFHPLSSLMVFADVGDRVGMEPAAARSFAVNGPFAAALADTGEADNLVVRAVDALAERTGKPLPPLRLTLTKGLPVASGLGGGSSDAGAALRLARQILSLPVDDDGMEAVAAFLGSDGAPCLWGRPVIAEGRGERLSAAPAMPPLPAVLVNPRVACPTGAVYRAYDAVVDPAQPADRPDLPEAFASVREAAAAMAACRNDLEAPAIGLVPVIGGVLERLRSDPLALMARLSGSGATCFALTGTDEEAQALAARLSEEHPGWWITACRFGGPWAD